MKKYTYWKDLHILKDISDDIEKNCKSNNTQFTNKDSDDFKESIQYYIEDYLTQNIELYKEYYFEELILDSLHEIILNDYNLIINDIDIDIEPLIFDAMQIYFYKNNNFRSYSGTSIIKSPDVKKIKKQLSEYENVEQPEQQTKEWYEFRREGLSASDIWKAIDTDSAKNNLIYSKCKPIDLTKKQSVNINSPFHNGHKYEPLSIMQYEFDFKTTVGEFGCIKHKLYPFLRASPDGINIDPKNKLYGRLVEVKNPTTRKLTGVPKKEYWIQMQLQMEVWNLNECDFLETVYKEYTNEEEFYKDGDSFIRTANGKRKGIMIHFFHNAKPHYEYSPVDISKKDFDIWYDKILEKNSHMNWITNCYWYLEDYSCVLVPRNKKWFNSIYSKLKNVWDTILTERKTGYEHRKPKKRKKKIKNLTPNSLNKLEENTKSLFKDTSISPKLDNNKNLIIKVRTESFEKN